MDGNEGEDEAAKGAEAIEKMMETGWRMGNGIQDSGGQHQGDIAYGGEVPGDERGGVIKDCRAFFGEDLLEEKDEKAGGEAGHGKMGMSHKGIGEFDAVKDTREEAGKAIESEDAKPDKKGSLPSRTGIFPILARVVDREKDGPKEKGSEAGDLAGVVVRGREGFGVNPEDQIQKKEDPDLSVEGSGTRGISQGAWDQEKKEDHGKGGVEKTRAGGATGAFVDCRVDGGISRKVEGKGNDQERKQTGKGAEMSLIILPPGEEENAPKKQDDDGKKDPHRSGPVEKDLAAGVSREPEEAAEHQTGRPGPNTKDAGTGERTG